MQAEFPSTPFALIESAVFDIPLRLPVVLESQRAQLRLALWDAQRRLRDFALKNGWEQHLHEPFAQQFRVYAQKQDFDQDLLHICGLETDLHLPETYCAALEQGILMCVSPDLYHSLYPQGAEPQAFEKLLAHEMAHRLHIRILDGSEDLMGPLWFYEGFALVAAGQFERDQPMTSDSEKREIMNDLERVDYRKYAALLRFYMSKHPMQQLIRKAAEPGFSEWLLGTS